MSDNLKEMQAAFEEWAGYSAEFNPSAWKAWQAAIASQQAAHEAEAELQREIETLQSALDAKVTICGDEQIGALKRENAELKAWKESAVAVMPDYQTIGKLLGVKLGDSVHDKILPAIEELTRLLEEAKSKAVPEVTDEMALAFHRALTDGAIGAGEVEEIKVGLRAAMLAAAPQPKEPKQ